MCTASTVLASQIAPAASSTSTFARVSIDITIIGGPRIVTH
jgi:hypothetical protein